MREVWQEYDCPQGMDFDLFDSAMVYRGASIQCSGCYGTHVAGVDVEVQTYVDDGGDVTFPPLPESAQELYSLVKGP